MQRWTDRLDQAPRLGKRVVERWHAHHHPEDPGRLLIRTNVGGKDEACARRECGPGFHADDPVLPQVRIDVVDMTRNRQVRVALGNDLGEYRLSHRDLT